MVADRRSLITAGALGLAAAVTGGAAVAAEGIVADAKGDQTAAVAAAALAARRAGKALLLPGGRIRVARLALPEGAVLLGVPGLTRLSAAVAGAPVLSLSRIRSARIEGVGFDGGSLEADAETGLLMASGVESLIVRDCSFAFGAGKGILAQKCGGLIEACRFEALETAIYVNDSTGMRIAGNRVATCTNNGILVHRTAKGFDGTIVSGNQITGIGAVGGGLGWYGNGINVYRAGQVLVTGNILKDCAFSFIRANGGDGVQILANNGLASGETGIYCEFEFEGAVIAQNVIEKSADGISVVNFNKGGRLASVTGNLVRGSYVRPRLDEQGSTYGAGISVEADTALSGNVVEGCARNAYGLGYGSYLRDVVMTGNVARNSAEGVRITVAKAEGTALIASNVFSGCSGGAVVGYEWEKRTTDDLAVAGAAMPAGITITGNLVS